jgi:hypothetical protein
MMIELLLQTLCDLPPATPADGAYLFGQTVDNQTSVFRTGVDLIQRQQARRLLIADSVSRSGYPGFAAWYQALMDLGLKTDKIRGVPTHSFPILHTLTEATALVRYAKAEKMRTIFVVAAPFHQLRAFMTTVTVALQKFPELRIYNRPGQALPWHETVRHSQGSLECQRSELIYSELERIERYQVKGDLASPEQILAYLSQRDI